MAGWTLALGLRLWPPSVALQFDRDEPEPAGLAVIPTVYDDPIPVGEDWVDEDEPSPPQGRRIGFR